MKDYYATLKIQQGRLKAAMQILGIETASELSRRSKVSQEYIGKLLNFKLSPRGNNGEWRVSTLLICKALGSEPNDLFPEHLQHEISTNKIASFVEHVQLQGGVTRQLGPDDECERNEIEQILNEVLDILPERERIILKGLFWDSKTLRQVGREVNLGIERTRHIKEHALRKLRHPLRLNKLKHLYPFISTSSLSTSSSSLQS